MNILTVSQINRYVKSLLEEDKKLADVYIKGEISNFTNHYRSGHFYFTLKDADASIRVVMFKSHASELRFEPENGMAVLLRASLGVYERDGIYQLYATDMQPDGAGALAVAFEQKKRKLAEKGLFDGKYKKPLPRFPVRIGIVTSETGAALQDVINVLARRYPIAALVVSPAQVQGKEASASIVKALKHLDGEGNCDVIIIARGGGSAEDLWAFNDEALAYAVFEANTPIVSAVGHETDYTICDFAADVRAPTPSAAAELVSEPVSELSKKLEIVQKFFERDAYFLLEKGGEKLEKLRNYAIPESRERYMRGKQQRLDFFRQSLYNKKRYEFDKLQGEIAARASILESLSPLRVLSRGYSVAFCRDKAVTKASELKKGDEITLRFRDGQASASVLEVNYEEKS